MSIHVRDIHLLGGVSKVAIPSGLGWTPTWKIVRVGSKYRVVGLNFTALKPTPNHIYYLHPLGSAANSPTNDNPADPITPRRFVTLANANTNVVEGRIAGGRYYGNIGFDGNNFTCAGVVLTSWAGTVSHPSVGRPTLVKRGTNAAAVWTLDQGNTYWTTHSTANTPVFDMLYQNAAGLPVRVADAADLATCRATLGSTFFDSGASRTYVTAQDGRSLIGDTYMMVQTSGTVFQYQPTVNATLWIEDIDFIGPVAGTMATAATTLSWNARNVGYFGGTNSLALTGTIDAINWSPRVGGGNSDGMNYHGNAQGQVRALEYDLRSIRSGFDASTANNTSTAHESCKVISVAGDYVGSQDRVIHDINSSKRFMAGSRIRASAGAGASAITVQAGSGGGTAAEIWLEGCRIDNSVSGGLFADTGCAVRHRRMNVSGLTTAGSGTIGAY